ncbi:MAG: GAF domain-containing protein [bacterium]
MRGLGRKRTKGTPAGWRDAVKRLFLSLARWMRFVPIPLVVLAFVFPNNLVLPFLILGGLVLSIHFRRGGDRGGRSTPSKIFVLVLLHAIAMALVSLSGGLESSYYVLFFFAIWLAYDHHGRSGLGVSLAASTLFYAVLWFLAGVGWSALSARILPLWGIGVIMLTLLKGREEELRRVLSNNAELAELILQSTSDDAELGRISRGIFQRIGRMDSEPDDVERLRRVNEELQTLRSRLDGRSRVRDAINDLCFDLLGSADEGEVYDAAMRAAASALSAGVCTVVVRDKGGAFRIGRSRGVQMGVRFWDGEGVLGSIESRRPLLVRDTKSDDRVSGLERSLGNILISVPIFAGGECKGALNVHRIAGGEPTEEDLKGLEEIGRFVSAALSALEVRKEEARGAGLSRLANRVLSLPYSVKNLEEALSEFSSIIGEAFPYDFCTIYLRDPATGELEERFSSGGGISLVLSPGPRGNGELLSLFRGGQLAVGDLERDGRFKPSNPSIRSFVATPMKWGDRLVGAVSLGRREPTSHIEDSLAEVLYLCNLAAAVFGSLKNFEKNR